MPLDFSAIDETIQFRQRSISRLLSIAHDIKHLDWRGEVDAWIDSVAIYTDDYEDHRHNVRIALAHYGEPVSRRMITYHPYASHFKDKKGHEVWSINGSYNSPVNLIYCFDADNPPDRLTRSGRCGFIRMFDRCWGYKTRGANP